MQAAIELRTALAEGDLVAVLNYEGMPLIERFRWREDDGLAIVLKGRLSNQVEGTLTQFRECVVVVNEADLMGGFVRVCKRTLRGNRTRSNYRNPRRGNVD